MSYGLTEATRYPLILRGWADRLCGATVCALWVRVPYPGKTRLFKFNVTYGLRLPFRKNMIGMQIEFGHDATVEELVPAVDWNTLIGKFNLGHKVLFSFVFF